MKNKKESVNWRKDKTITIIAVLVIAGFFLSDTLTGNVSRVKFEECSGFNQIALREGITKQGVTLFDTDQNRVVISVAGYSRDSYVINAGHENALIGLKNVRSTDYDACLEWV